MTPSIIFQTPSQTLRMGAAMSLPFVAASAAQLHAWRMTMAAPYLALVPKPDAAPVAKVVKAADTPAKAKPANARKPVAKTAAPKTADTKAKAARKTKAPKPASPPAKAKSSAKKADDAANKTQTYQTKGSLKPAKVTLSAMPETPSKEVKSDA
ncbi:hypothetical protein [Nereida sp. MMG025]|uniref:hypothetical protein n=1 Tax=Nereida sp. MMG025 TaxID=2909981 RepID=UPI001F2EA98F|nr:hypothetical protein [Nereida sp. MMG025]MCF6445296.1 hypothetical protein [Nereida sp. MMG025]